MRYRWSMTFLAVMLAANAEAQSGVASSRTPGSVYQYAIDNPVSDSRLRVPPTLGESVPASITLVPLDGDDSYAYFYYNGRPVIVDVGTRAVVRVGK